MKPLKYNLPQEQIAIRPLETRSQSKLLVYNNQNINSYHFSDLHQFLHKGQHIFLNNTKVIEARILLKKETGAQIELLLLEPMEDTLFPFEALHFTDQIYWKALIGGASKFKTDQPLTKMITIDGRTFPIYFEKIKALKDGFVVKIFWENPNPDQYSFGEILPLLGHTPIPPYLNRASEENDQVRYQTIFAKNDGSVAAPTSSLHYDSEIIDKIKEKGVKIHELTLHIGAGTFMPIKTDQIEDHHMHQEWMIIRKSTLEHILEILDKEEDIIASGTTSARFLESLYWYGLFLLKEGRLTTNIHQDFIKKEWKNTISTYEIILHLFNYWEQNNIEQQAVTTSIFIYPDYQFRIIKGLITNFHQPESTLLLLVAAFIGEDWKKVYDYALKNNYRFLSYGDASLLFPSKNLKYAAPI